MKKLLFASALALTGSVFATTTSYSPPVGAVTTTLAAPVNGVPKSTFFTPALRMTTASSFVGPVYGTVSALTTTSITDAAGGWPAGALSQAATPYFIKFLSGAASGTWWQISTMVSNTTNGFTVLPRAGTNLSALGAAPGDTYQIVPADTLEILFNSVQASIGGTSQGVSDTVQFFDGTGWHTYWFNSTAGQWREGAAPFNKNNIVIPPDSGVLFIRNHPGTVSLVLLGSVATRAERIIVPSFGSAVVGSVYRNFD